MVSIRGYQTSPGEVLNIQTCVTREEAACHPPPTCHPTEICSHSWVSFLGWKYSNDRRKHFKCFCFLSCRLLSNRVISWDLKFFPSCRLWKAVQEKVDKRTGVNWRWEAWWEFSWRVHWSASAMVLSRREKGNPTAELRLFKSPGGEKGIIEWHKRQRSLGEGLMGSTVGKRAVPYKQGPELESQSPHKKPAWRHRLL